MYPYADMVRHDVLRMVPPDGKVIGSIGCGTGATEAVLVQQGRVVHGVDTAPEAVASATGRLTSVRLIAPSNECPFEPHSLDGLILADVLEHIPSAWELLNVFATAVRPGGWVVISVPNMREIGVLRRFFLMGDWPEESAGVFDRTHVQMMSRRRLNRWCHEAGLAGETWFDRYRCDFNGPRRYRLHRVLDALTLRLFHEWFTYQIQVRCRKR